MSKGRELRCYDYVNRPYSQVRDALSTSALAIFQSATKAAAARAQSDASALHIDIGGFEVGADIRISVHQIAENSDDPLAIPTTRLQLEWQSAVMPSMFPLMKADLYIYAFTPTETQLDFWGFYEPPLGALGKVVNTIVGHRIAEVSVHHFVNDVAERLRRTLSAPDHPAEAIQE